MSVPTHRRTTPTTFRTAARGTTAALAVTAAGLLVAGLVATTAPAYAADATVGLGTARSYAVLAGSTVTNTGASVITGDLGLSPGSAVTGFPPGRVLGGAMHISDAAALKAKNDLTTGYNDAAGRPSASDVTGVDLGGLTLTPGVYEASTGMSLTGTVTLNAQGNPAAVFIFKAGTTLVTASGSSVEFINGGSPCNVFWQVGSSATVGTATRLVGTLMATASISMATSATLQGRALALDGAVTLDSNVITAPSCSTVPTGTGTSTDAPTSGSDPTSSDGPSSTDGSTDDSDDTTPTASSDRSTAPSSSRSPVIPTGRPDTGLGGSQESSGRGLFGLAGLAGLGAVLAGALGAARTPRRRG